MSWTEERIEALRRLWDEGLSASRIAGQLGIVSRNAVIGKVHRLGLSSRPKPAAVAAAEARRALRDMEPTGPSGSDARATGTDAPSFGADHIRDGSVAVVNPAPTAPFPLANGIVLAAPPPPRSPLDLAPVLAPGRGGGQVAIPETKLVGIMDLRDGVCRWPVGDPLKPGFAYCGANCDPGRTYCVEHSALAYQPSIERRRDRLPSRI